MIQSHNATPTQYFMLTNSLHGRQLWIYFPLFPSPHPFLLRSRVCVWGSQGSQRESGFPLSCHLWITSYLKEATSDLNIYMQKLIAFSATFICVMEADIISEVPSDSTIQWFFGDFKGTLF